MCFGCRVWVIKGEFVVNGKWNLIWLIKKLSRKMKVVFRLVIIGVNIVKDIICNWLYVEVLGFGFMYFLVDCDIGYFE